LDVFYGGAVGGGKSDALLMGALQYMDTPGYSAILLRATFKELSLPDAIMSRSKEWLMNTDAKWSESEKTWTFPSGAVLCFGHLDGPNDHHQYQSAAFQFIGIDEASKLRWNQIRYMFSRLRKKVDMYDPEGRPVPLRFRMASNPGGPSHEPIKVKYIDPKTRKKTVIFVPAWLEDNPHLDQEAYELSLMELDYVTREQLRKGRWDVVAEGGLFKRHWFKIVPMAPIKAKRIRYWDLAATEKVLTVTGRTRQNHPDWTVGAKLAWDPDGILYIEDIIRVQETPRVVEKLVKQAAILDERSTSVVMEQEPGAAGKNTIDNYLRNVLPGWDFHGDRPTGQKEEYARPLSAYSEAGNVCIFRDPRWNGTLLNEFEAFPYDLNDDIVDAVSKGFWILSKTKKRCGTW